MNPDKKTDEKQSEEELSEQSRDIPKEKDDSFILPPQTIQKKCWNCGSDLTNDNWCDVCRAPLNQTIKEEVLSRLEPAGSIKCWRCGGTTSGDVCGICGSPLTKRALTDIKEVVKLPTQTEQEEPEFIFILSPRDRQLVRIGIRYSEIEALVKKHFKVDRGILTNYGPEMIIQKPEDTNVYSSFEREDLFTKNNIRVIFKRLNIQTEGTNFVTMRFFFWKAEDTTQRFTFKNLRWKLLFLIATIVTIVLTGWFYSKEIYSILTLESSMAIDILIFTLALLAIITIHELGHIVTQKTKKINLSLPYFMPIPPIPGFMSYFMLGTAGGFIRVLDPIHRRNDLFDLYFYGSIFGLVLSIVFVLIGSAFPYIEDMANLSTEALERVETLQQFDPIMIMQNFLAWFTDVTNIAPSFNPTTQILFKHPLTYAGTVGIIINGLNYLPGSIFDGGYMFRSVFGERFSRIFSFVAALFLMFNYNTWFLGVLAMFTPMNMFQTPVTNEALPIHWSRYVLEALALGIVVICFPLPAFFFNL